MQEVFMRVPGDRVSKSKPMAVKEYNDYMSGVDKSDQLLQYYSMNIKTVKWLKKNFFRFLELCLINAQKLYNIHRKSQNRKPLTLFFYAIQVCEALTDINKRATLPTQSSFQFTPKNFIDMKN